MPPDARDRRFVLAILVVATIGVVALGSGVWGLVHPAPEWMPFRVQVAPWSGVAAGLILLGFAVAESLHRLRRGPQPPGRHARPGERRDRSES